MVGSEKGSFGGFLAEKWRFLVWGFGLFGKLEFWNFGRGWKELGLKKINV